MQSEHFDNKIREAADHHHPAYDEKAWEKMEKLLDKHLPQKKDDRRRIIFFLLLFVLLGGGTWFFLSRSGNSDKTISKTNQPDQPVNLTTTTNNNQTSSEKDKTSFVPKLSADNKNSEKNTAQEKEGNKTTTVFNRNKYTQSVVSMINDRLKKSVQTNSTSSQDRISGIKQKQKDNNNISDKATVQETETKPTQEIEGNKDQRVVIETKNSLTEDKVNSESTANKTNNENTKEVNEKAKDNNPESADKKDISVSKTTSASKKSVAKNKKNNYFFFSLSAGPDMSAAGINKVGKVKAVYGIGVGFSFHDKFSLSTGFYSARKIYTASPDEYHPPYNFWTYYPYLKKVDADCRVFEMPVTLSYNFTHSKEHSIFGTAGISSYIMKRETYNYISKLPSGQTTEKEVEYYNKNKHFFSVVTLSGGYQRNISKSVSIAAEPYVKIPVDGVGFGKVQLNSAGILFSLHVKPFTDKKQKEK